MTMSRNQHRRSYNLAAISLGVSLVLGCGTLHAQNLPLECGQLTNHYGPFDYRTDRSKLPVVEHAHFDSGVESLTRGKSTEDIGGDIDYTLRAFPNHHRALMAMMRLGEREKTSKPRAARYTVECYFRRAEYFRPDDGLVKMLTGIYLMKQGRNGEALGKLEAAEKLDSGDPNLQYNLGLAYFRLGRYEEALAHAHRAYAKGFALPGLKGLLVKAGKWRDAEQASPPGTPVKGADGDS